MRVNGSVDSAKLAASGRQACLATVSSLRDFWRNLGFINFTDQARVELGKKVSDGLFKVFEYGLESLEEQVTPKREFTRVCDPQRVAALVCELDDPVLAGLWGLNTVQAMLDLLTHNALHLWDRHYLMESTLDYAMARGASVSPSDVGERGLPFCDEDAALTRKVAPALGLTHVRGDQYQSRTGIVPFIPLQETSQAQQLARALNIGITLAGGMLTAIALDQPHLTYQVLGVQGAQANTEEAKRRAIVTIAARIVEAAPGI